MLTINSKTTKDELVAEVERLRKERKTVVTTARRYAKDYRWCDVVDECLREAGLSDLLPAQYFVESKSSARAKWDEYDGPYDKKDDAVEVAIATRNCDVAPPSSGRTTRFDAFIDATTDVEELVTMLREQAARVQPKAFKPPKYPIYRVVLVGDGRTEPEVVAVVDHTEVKED